MRAHAISLLLAGSLFFPSLRAVATPIQLPVQIEEQEQANWCWSASALALLNRYNIYPGVTLETGTGDRGQCLIEQKLPAHAAYDCCDAPEDCNALASVASLEDIIENDYGLDMTVTGTTTKPTLINLVTAGKPVLIDRYDGSIAHLTVVIGYNDTSDKFNILEVDGGSVVDKYFTDIVSEGAWTWVYTLYPNTAPQDDVYLRYTWTDWESSWTYSAPGDVIAGPDYTVLASDEQIVFTCGSDDAITMSPGFAVAPGANFLAVPQS